MIKYKTGNLLKADVEALVNTVNTVGVMGKGIALQFKQAFPENFKAYEQAHRRDEITHGKVMLFQTGAMFNPKYILNFPTKRHWRGKARLDDIEAGLEDMVRLILEHQIKSIAIPPLGCGYGGLNWNDVGPRIERAVGELKNVEIWLYPPTGAPDPSTMPIGTEKPNLTFGRAALIALISKYKVAGYKLTLLEVQKLAYFMQTLGEPLKLQYEKEKFGPYANNLRFVLQRLEGHYIRGYGDHSQRAAIHLMDGAEAEAWEFLQKFPDTLDRVNKVAELIEGFETPYGMELLATAMWLVFVEETEPQLSEITRGFFEWNRRKRDHFQKDHIEVAWHRLEEQLV